MRWKALLTLWALVGSGCFHLPRTQSPTVVVSADAAGVGSALGRRDSGGLDCDEEFKRCMKRCWDKRYPWPHTQQQGGWYHERCEQDCNKEYNACEEEKEKEEARQQEKLTFSRMVEAVVWLSTHKAEVALGAIVVVAGVAFVLTTGGAGALILVPLTL